MSKFLHGALVGLAALFVTHTSAAAALTVTPSGAYTARSGSMSFTFSSNGQVFTCTSSSIPMSINSAGTGTVAQGAASYSSCTNSSIGSFTATQSRQWTVRVDLISLGGPGSGETLLMLRFDVPATGLFISSGICGFYLTGSFELGVLFHDAFLPVTIPSPWAILGVTRQSLSVDFVSGCSPLVTTLSLRVGSLRASYGLDRSMTVSG